MNDVSTLNKEAQLLLRNLFYNRLVQLETKSNESIVFSKQMEIKKLQDQVERFIETNPDGKFEIRVLEKNTENIENYRHAIVIKNYRHDDEVKRVTLYFIVIDNAFDSVTFYQVALNGVVLSI
jgi:hypothetical protein